MEAYASVPPPPEPQFQQDGGGYYAGQNQVQEQFNPDPSAQPAQGS